MSRRSYRQYCAMARALDVLGERWTLLIVRELLTGPKRFKDLLGGLPGIGTNLLAGRLKELEGEGLLRRTTLPPPAGSAVYELTGRGRDLEPVLMGLARWGVDLLGEPRPGEAFKPAWEPDLILRTDPDTFLALVSGRTEASDAIEAGRLDIEGDAEALARVGEIFGLSTGLPPA